MKEQFINDTCMLFDRILTGIDMDTVRNILTVALQDCEYELVHGLFCAVPEESCCTCKHCTDVFWDYSNGIYMLICELENEGTGDICDMYQWDEEIKPDADDNRFKPLNRKGMMS